MEGISEQTPTKSQQVTVDVPEERVAEFHAFFARFLAGRGRRRRRGEHGRHGHGRGRGCAHRQERSERSEAHEAGQSPEITQV